MSINDEFELVPRGALKDLKKEIELLKQGQTRSGDDDLSKNITLLRKSVDAMYDLFKKAAEEIKLEDRDQNLIEKKLEPLTSKIEVLSEQNQKIAKALVTISNMVQDNMKKIDETTKKMEDGHVEMPKLPEMVSQSITPPMMPTMSGSQMSNNSSLSTEPLPRPASPSYSLGSRSSGGLSMPPPPPKKKGFF